MVERMNDTLGALYDSLYTPPVMAGTDREAMRANRALLRERLAVGDRRIVLRIVKELELTALGRSYDRFICGRVE